MSRNVDQNSEGFRRTGRKRGHGAKSDAVRQKAILALLSEKSISAAAERCGLNEKTLRVWMTEDGFSQQLADARRAAFEAGMSRVQVLTSDAIETLAALMAPDVSGAVRLGAARTIAELGLRERDAEIILRKLDEIEAAQKRR